MPSTYTTSLKIQQIGNGEQSGVWGNTTNTNWSLVEQAITGVQTITMVNADYTLSNLNGVLDEARNAVLVVNGTNSAVRKVIAPANQEKVYIVSNQTSGGFDITIGTISGSYVTIKNGTTVQVYTDGSNFYSGQSSSGGSFDVNGNLVVTGTSAFTGVATFSASPVAPTPSNGDNSTKVATTAFVANNSVPSGGLLMWPTNTAPSGFLLCNGAAVSRSTYATLFALFGTTFGSGDGSTTFNLPNYINSFPVGAGALYSAGSTGGSKDAVVVAHNHTATSTSTSSVSDPGHSHVISISPDLGWGGVKAGTTSVSPSPSTSSSTTGISVSTSTSTTIASSGVSGTDANLPPYVGIYFIIKT